MSFMVTWENVAGTIAFGGFTLTLREAVKALLNSDITSSDDAPTPGWLGERMSEGSRFIQGQLDFSLSKPGRNKEAERAVSQFF